MGLIPRLAEDRCSGLPSRIESQVLAQKALIRDRIVGKPAVGTESWEVICQKAFSRTRLGGCPKTLPHGLPQIADSIAVRFPGFAAHKHDFDIILRCRKRGPLNRFWCRMIPCAKPRAGKRSFDLSCHPDTRLVARLLKSRVCWGIAEQKRRVWNV